jgi:hypothetical protein
MIVSASLSLNSPPASDTCETAPPFPDPPLPINATEPRRAFRSCEPAIRDLVLKACRQRLQLIVYVDVGADPQIRRIVVTCC